MVKARVSINAKKFVEDYRSGMSREELVRAHDLELRKLDKVLRTFVEKGLLHSSEIRPEGWSELARSSPRIKAGSRPVGRPDGRLGVGGAKNSSEARASTCPQCGAEVSRKSLTCPECGHVLPGEERWANLGPKKGFFERVPPLALGCMLALPMAIAVFFAFKEIILPMVEVASDKKVESLRSDQKGSNAYRLGQEIARKKNVRALNIELERFREDAVFSSWSDDYATFVTGPQWAELSPDQQSRVLATLRDAIRKAAVEVDFDVVDPAGLILATVTDQSIQLGLGARPEDVSPQEGDPIQVGGTEK